MYHHYGGAHTLTHDAPSSHQGCGPRCPWVPPSIHGGQSYPGCNSTDHAKCCCNDGVNNHACPGAPAPAPPAPAPAPAPPAPPLVLIRLLLPAEHAPCWVRATARDPFPIVNMTALQVPAPPRRAAAAMPEPQSVLHHVGILLLRGLHWFASLCSLSGLGSPSHLQLRLSSTRLARAATVGTHRMPSWPARAMGPRHRQPSGRLHCSSAATYRCCTFPRGHPLPPLQKTILPRPTR